MTQDSARRVLAVIPDLYFATRVAATAKLLRIALELTAPRAAAQAAAEWAPALVLVDLHVQGMAALIAAVRTSAPSASVVGFYSHVATALRDEAIAAGADAALPRSQFVARLPALLERGVG